VTVVANGSGDVISIKIAREIVDPEDVEFLEEAVLSGVKQAIAQGKDLAQSEMTKITGGMGWVAWDCRASASLAVSKMAGGAPALQLHDVRLVLLEDTNLADPELSLFLREPFVVFAELNVGMGV
jgi:Uncharacterized protein conserved in bacteria